MSVLDLYLTPMSRVIYRYLQQRWRLPGASKRPCFDLRRQHVQLARERGPSCCEAGAAAKGRRGSQQWTMWTWEAPEVNGNDSGTYRNHRNQRFLPNVYGLFLRAMFQESPHENMAWTMVQDLHFRILKCSLSWDTSWLMGYKWLSWCGYPLVIEDPWKSPCWTGRSS